jgi:hypothetical protein
VSARADLRRPLSDASLLTVAEAIREIGGRESEVRAWLHEAGLVRTHPRLGKRVLWGDVLRALAPSEDAPAPEPAPVQRLPRVALGRKQ